MGKSHSRLLILSCSRSKRATSGLLPAIERYDGPAFRVLRKFLARYPAAAGELNVYVLSAQFGLISSSTPTPWYDVSMNAARAAVLNQNVLTALKLVLARQKYGDLFINAGHHYFAALAGYEVAIPASLEVKMATGSSGRRISQLRDWLYGGPPIEEAISILGVAHLRGITIRLTPIEIIDIAQRALEKEIGNPNGYQSWYVPLNGRRVAPKWLVSQLTGLAVNRIVTSEALRVLAQLGIKVVRA